MGSWKFWNKKSEDTNILPALAQDQKVNSDLLEDRPPKFEDDPTRRVLTEEQQAKILKRTVASIGSDDFKNLHKVPCFRRAMMTGGGIAAVTFGVLVTAKSSYRRGTNWAFLGFLMGSIASWEQCRYVIRKSNRSADEARRVLVDKGRIKERESSKS
jgi:hypothetical protein